MAPSATTVQIETNENAAVGALGKISLPRSDGIRLYRKQHLEDERGFDEDVAGHISVRGPILTDHFCVRSHPGINEAGEVVVDDVPINNAAFAIHSEIHKARLDVNATCRAHSVYGKAFSVFGEE